jgi:putative flippase GtrA
MSTRDGLRRLTGVGARFLTVGAISTLIEIGVFNLLYLALGWNVVVAKIVASLVALVNAYFGNREWTFRHRGMHARPLEVTLFIVVNACCTTLGALIVWGGVAATASATAGDPGALIVNIVNLASIAVVILVRFLLYHHVVFRGERARAANEPPRTPVGDPRPSEPG